jgi:ADP-ribose pyrophosphatase YjhB (NUDIX family)
VEEKHVVTVFLRHEGKILLLRRSERVGSYRGRWAGVAGYLDADPLAQAMTEIGEETGLSAADVHLVGRGRAVAVDDAELGRRWTVHPFLFDVAEPERVRLDWEHTEAAWVRPGEILERETVPGLWEAYLSASEGSFEPRDLKSRGG